MLARLSPPQSTAVQPKIHTRLCHSRPTPELEGKDRCFVGRVLNRGTEVRSRTQNKCRYFSFRSPGLTVGSVTLFRVSGIYRKIPKKKPRGVILVIQKNRKNSGSTFSQKTLGRRAALTKKWSYLLEPPLGKGNIRTRNMIEKYTIQLLSMWRSTEPRTRHAICKEDSFFLLVYLENIRAKRMFLGGLGVTAPFPVFFRSPETLSTHSMTDALYRKTYLRACQQE